MKVRCGIQDLTEIAVQRDQLFADLIQWNSGRHHEPPFERGVLRHR